MIRVLPHSVRHLGLSLGAVGAMSVLAPSSFAAEPNETRAARPNIVFIMSDDHGYQAMSCYGSRVNETPNMDRLARDGMRFDRAYVTNSLCGPCRAVLLTGKYSHLNGFAQNGDRFDGSQQHIGKLLQQAGYRTAVIGKWHLETDPTGFDHWQVLQGQGPYYNPVMLTHEGRRPIRGYVTEIITDLTLDWLSRQDGSQPFFLLCWHKAPHRNWEPGPKQLDLYDGVEFPEPETLFDDYRGRGSAAARQEMTIARDLTRHDLKLDPPHDLDAEQRIAWDAAYRDGNAAYEAAKLSGDELTRWNYQRYVADYLRCVAAVDESVGRVLDHLDETGLAENTIVVYSSDQGWYLGEHGWYDKRWMYEESFRTPLLIRWPGRIEPGSVNSDLCMNLDLPETFLEAAGVPIPDDMQGRSLVPILEGRTPDDWRREVYYHYYEYPGPHMVAKHYGIRTERHKLIRFPELDEWELYDLEKDPHELTSVHADPAYAEVRADLERRLEALRQHYRDDDSVIDPSAARRRSLPAETVVREGVDGAVVSLPIHHDSTEANDPSQRPLTVGAWVEWSGDDGTLLAHGGETHGYLLGVRDRRPTLSVRLDGRLQRVVGAPLEPSLPTHLAARIDERGRAVLMIDGRAVGDPVDVGLIRRRPADGIDIGRDAGSSVDGVEGTRPWSGSLRDVRLILGPMSDEAFAEWATRRP